MWVFVLSRKITGAFTVEQELNALNADFPKNVFKHVGKTRALVMVPVDDCVVGEIQILVDNPNFIPGSAKLAWFQEDLREDILRTIEENEAKEKSTDNLKAEAMSGLADLLGSMGQLRGFASRMPGDLKQKMRDRAKKCTDPDCGVTRILAEDDKGGKANVASAADAPFAPGDTVFVRRWDGLCPRNEIFYVSFEPGMEVALGSPQKVKRVVDGAVELESVAGKGWPFIHVSKTPWPSDDAAPIKVGDKVTWRDGAAHVWTGTVTDDLLSGVNRTAEYSHHDRFIVEMAEGGETVCAAPRADMLRVVQAATPDVPGTTAFKVGDKVTIVSGFESAELVFRDDMGPLIGKQGVVVHVTKSGNYAVKVDGDGSAWSWPASSLNLTESAPAGAAPDSPQ